MNEEQQLKLQAFLDGELSEGEAREVAVWVARDRDATALLAELRNTRQALAGFEADLKVPESREFYWSKIAREIERVEPERQPVQAVSLFAAFRRLLVPATALAALALALILVGVQKAAAPDTEITVADSGAFTYHDYDNGTTLVWLSYPAESEFAQPPAR